VSRPAVWSLYAALVVIWSSTWVSIKIDLDDVPPLLGAGLRFALAGAVLLGWAAVSRRPLRTDATLATILALLPFATTYGLIYRGEQHVPSGLAAVLFGALPLYVALLAGALLPDEPLHARLVAAGDRRARAGVPRVDHAGRRAARRAGRRGGRGVAHRQRDRQRLDRPPSRSPRRANRTLRGRLHAHIGESPGPAPGDPDRSSGLRCRGPRRAASVELTTLSDHSSTLAGIGVLVGRGGSRSPARRARQTAEQRLRALAGQLERFAAALIDRAHRGVRRPRRGPRPSARRARRAPRRESRVGDAQRPQLDARGDLECSRPSCNRLARVRRAPR